MYDEQTQRRWIVLVADDSSYLEFCSSQFVRWGVGNFVPGSLGLDLPEVPVTYNAESCEWIAEPVPVERRPTHLPTAVSLLARAEAYMRANGNLVAPNRYGFVVWADSNVLPVLGAGSGRGWLTSFPDGQPPWLSGEQASNHAEVDFWPDGLTRQYAERNSTHQRGVNAAPNPEGSPPLPPTQPLGYDVQTVPTWQLPNAATMAGVGVAALVAGALYYVWPGAKGLAVGLFSRLRKDKAFTHEQRARIEQALRAEPGLHAVELARRLAMSRGAVEHHLAQLGQAGLVTSVSSGRYRCYFLAGSVDRRAMNAAPVLKAEGARTLLAAIHKAPGESLTELAHATGLSSATVHHQANRLEKAGLVQRERRGRSMAHFATDLGTAMSTNAP